MQQVFFFNKHYVEQGFNHVDKLDQSLKMSAQV